MRRVRSGMIGVLLALMLLASALGATTAIPIGGSGDSLRGAPSGHLERLIVPSTATNYTVIFHGLGLTTPTYWTVAFAGQVKSTTSIAIQFQIANGTYQFDVSGGGSTFTPSPASGSIVVNGSDLDYNVSWLRLYNLVFAQSGLPNNSPWFVFIQLLNKNAYTPATITYRMPNGTYNFSAGSSLPYEVSPKTGVLVVNGSDLRTNITFTPDTRHAVTFTESGLSAGLAWYVSLGSALNVTASGGPLLNISYLVADGSHPWAAGTPTAFVARPSTGSAVVNGSDVMVVILFGPPTTYPLTFVQSGLPTGASWAVTLDGSTTSQGLGGADIVFGATNGSHSYAVTTNSGLVPFPVNGLEGVAGRAATVSVAFSPPARSSFTVVFAELGLPNGSWWVRLGGTNLSGPAGSGLSFFALANGSYPFVTGASDSWIPIPSSGTIPVKGADLLSTIVFSTNSTGPSGSPPKPPSSPSLTSYLPAAVVGMSVVVVALGALAWRGRKAIAPVPSPAPASDPAVVGPGP